MHKPTITLIGCGKMGGAMLRGWLAGHIADHIFIIEPNGLPNELKNSPDITLTTTPPASDIFILAVKPQIMNDICQLLSPSQDTLILSIAAGQKLGGFKIYFGQDQPVIRAMPNTPAAIGQGITVAMTNHAVKPDQKSLAHTLLSAIGQVEWVEDESLMDAVTALSGSGPAYVFYLIECMASAGIAGGLPADLSMRLARQTVIGSAALAAADPETSAGQLRKNVTSPGGTTAAALDILMDQNAMTTLFEKAIAQATARSKELSA